MRRFLPVLILVLVAGVLVLAVLMARGRRGEDPPAGSQPPRIAKEPPTAPAPVAGAPVAAGPQFVAPVPAAQNGSGYREARAYRLVLDGARCTLEAVEETRGDFRKPRAVARAAGMVSCRVLDAAGRLLAEETMPAPDQVCVVLDPVTPDAAGRPTPAKLTPPGPVTFQTRLPAVPGAATLEVIRLSGAPAATLDDRPPGQVLASIPLATR